jgi:fluoroquinolone resistance protein
MSENYIAEKTFNKEDYTLTALLKGEYENCKFNYCDFSGSDLSGVRFLNCEFVSCNLSLAALTKTSFNDVNFKDCKMLGLRFENCNDFGLAFSFDSCKLDHSSFYKLKLKKTVFKNNQLHEVDFTEADLSNSSFEYCDFLHATFDRTNLEKTDFRTATHYIIDPDKNRIKKARFSQSGLAGLLSKYDILITQ